MTTDQEKLRLLLWRCGMRMTRPSQWIVINRVPPWMRDEAQRPLKPSRNAIRNSVNRLARLRGKDISFNVLRRFGAQYALDNLPRERWAELYQALEDEAGITS